MKNVKTLSKLIIALSAIIFICGCGAEKAPKEKTEEDKNLKPFYDYKGNKKWGYKDKNGKIIIKPQFDNGYRFHEGIAGIKMNEKYGYINKKGKIVIKPIFDEQFYFREGLAKVKINGKYGFINKKEAEVIKPKFYSANDFFEGLARVCTDSNCSKTSFINKSGKIVLNIDFLYVGDFSDGLAIVCTGNKYVFRYNNCGYINKKGGVVIKPQFDYAQNFSEGLAVVKILGKENIEPRPKWAIEYKIKGDIKKGKHGYINKQGELIIEAKYDSANNFVGGLAEVVLNGKRGLIDKKGKWIKALRVKK